jgi:hypothetical protein
MVQTDHTPTHLGFSVASSKSSPQIWTFSAPKKTRCPNWYLPLASPPGAALRPQPRAPWAAARPRRLLVQVRADAYLTLEPGDKSEDRLAPKIGPGIRMGIPWYIKNRHFIMGILSVKHWWIMEYNMGKKRQKNHLFMGIYTLWSCVEESFGTYHQAFIRCKSSNYSWALIHSYMSLLEVSRVCCEVSRSSENKHNMSKITFRTIHSMKTIS